MHADESKFGVFRRALSHEGIIKLLHKSKDFVNFSRSPIVGLKLNTRLLQNFLQSSLFFGDEIYTFPIWTQVNLRKSLKIVILLIPKKNLKRSSPSGIREILPSFLPLSSCELLWLFMTSMIRTLTFDLVPWSFPSVSQGVPRRLSFWAFRCRLGFLLNILGGVCNRLFHH